MPASFIALYIGAYFFAGFCVLVVFALMDAKYKDGKGESSSGLLPFNVVTMWPFVIFIALIMITPYAVQRVYNWLVKAIKKDLDNLNK